MLQFWISGNLKFWRFQVYNLFIRMKSDSSTIETSKKVWWILTFVGPVLQQQHTQGFLQWFQVPDGAGQRDGHGSRWRRAVQAVSAPTPLQRLLVLPWVTGDAVTSSFKAVVAPSSSWAVAVTPGTQVWAVGAVQSSLTTVASVWTVLPVEGSFTAITPIRTVVSV